MKFIRDPLRIVTQRRDAHHSSLLRWCAGRAKGWRTDWKILVPRLEDDWNAKLRIWLDIGWYWMIYWNDILEWYIGHGLMVDVCPARTPRGSTGKVWKPWWKAGVLPGFLAGYEDINQEWSPIFFRHTWSYSHKPVLFGSFSCVIEQC